MVDVPVEVWSSLRHLFGEEQLRSRTVEKSGSSGTTLDRFLCRIVEEHSDFPKFFYKPGTRDPSGRV